MRDRATRAVDDYDAATEADGKTSIDDVDASAHDVDDAAGNYDSDDAADSDQPPMPDEHDPSRRHLHHGADSPGSPMNTDKLVIRIVVCTLAVISVGGYIVLAACALTHTQIPDALDRFAFGALTALMALLSKTSTDHDTQPVEVVNADTQPVPVDATPLVTPSPLPEVGE